MVRRFPPYLIGVPTSSDRYETIVSIATRADGELTWGVFVDECREQYRKPDTGDRYSESYLKRILPTFDRLGVIDRRDGIVTPSPPARRWLTNETDFETFLWHALKRRWVLQNRFPRGIEGLREVHDAVIDLTDDKAGAGVSRKQIQTYLSSERDYEFGDNDIRGYPQLLVQLGALEKEESRYHCASDLSKYKRWFTENDIFRQFEQRLRREGATVEPPEDRVKRDLAKYYLYRECGGLGKERAWYDTFWKDYLKDEARAGESPRARLKKSQTYRDAKSERKSVFREVRDKFEPFTSRDLQGLSTDVLRRMKQADSFHQAQQIKITAGSGISRFDLQRLASDTRAAYTFPDEFNLYEWQETAVERWFSPDKGISTAYRGIAQVVTGAGKTVMALEIIRKWLAENPDGVVTVLVPTQVLMHQWLTELTTKLNVPVEDIGWAGGGHKDSFTDGCRILVSIINSAVKDDYLRNVLAAADRPPHLLIADECHRYTGEVFSNVFDYPRTAELGLSATPLSQTVSGPGTEAEIKDDLSLTDDDELLLDELGPIYYTLTYDEGLEQGLIPEFSINYIGFELTPAERQTYETLSRKISTALSDIRSRHGHRLDRMGGGFNQNLQTLLQRDDLSTSEISDYFEYTTERRKLVADAAVRQAITHRLLTNAIDDEKKTIVFQERIEQLERMVAPFDQRGRNVRTDEVTDTDSRAELYEMYPELETVDQQLETLLTDADYKPVMYHSGHSRPIWNEFAMEWFRDTGFANVMLSVKALIEGVDVPDADVGIIRVSSSNVRQRIQTLGRVLRTGGDPASHSEMYVLYARNTVDEQIFDKHDWQTELTNADINHYFWETEESEIDGELRPASSDEIPEGRFGEKFEIPDVSDLERGDSYPGPRDGYQISVDSTGRPFEPHKNSRQYITTPAIEDAATYVHQEKGGGRIIINEAGHMLTRLPSRGLVFLGVLDDGLEAIEYGEDEGRLSEDAPTSLEDL